jgi:serine/threonine protein phosphatase PrpC
VSYMLPPRCRDGESVSISFFLFSRTAVTIQVSFVDMQDAHKVVLNLQEENDESPSFFAVYDGHCSECCR